MMILHRTAEEYRIHSLNHEDIVAIKLGDSPNHAQQVDAPAAAVARCNQ
jgi:hypothetical protein